MLLKPPKMTLKLVKHLDVVLYSLITNENIRLQIRYYYHAFKGSSREIYTNQGSVNYIEF